MSFDEDLIACAQLVERGDPDRFMATMAAPVALRKVLFPIYAFNVEVSRAPWVTKEAIIAEMRLQWWTDALEEIASGGVVRRHEVVTSLAHVLDPTAARELQKVVAARIWDVYRDPFKDVAAFTKYIEDTASSLLLAACQATCASMSIALKEVGYSSGLAQYLCAIPEWESQGRIPLVDGQQDAVRALAADGLSRLKNARSNAGDIPKVAQPFALSAWQAEPILKQVVADPSKVASGTLGTSQAFKKARLLWQATTGRW